MCSREPGTWHALKKYESSAIRAVTGNLLQISPIPSEAAEDQKGERTCLRSRKQLRVESGNHNQSLPKPQRLNGCK